VLRAAFCYAAVGAVMAFEIGVVCGECERHNALGAAACACGHELKPSPRPARPASRPRVAAVKAEAGLEGPTSALFGRGDLKPRRGPAGAAGAGGGGADPSAASLRPLGPQAAESGVSSVGGGAGVDPWAPAAPSKHGGADLSLEELMEQAKNYVCRSCSTPVPMGHKFCGRCGAAMPPEILAARTQFFGQLQVPGRAKLILIRGEGVEGLSYQLNADQHIVGRNGQLVFTDDPFISPRHANLFYRNGKLVVRDEGSLNGVFWRVHGTVELTPGDLFLAGEQLFLVEGAPRPGDGPAPDGTYFYTSPKHQTHFKLVQLLEGGAAGMAVCARAPALQIGREGGELNFPLDLYMSAAHCRVEDTGGGALTLTDLNSRNGTYIRLKAERELGHGDYLFIGRKLLRVEVTSN
jgi:pSer/pThr/pTyr-binding forkhead associated (FHA) protein